MAEGSLTSIIRKVVFKAEPYLPQVPKPKQNITSEKYAGFFPHDILGQTIAQQRSRTNMYKRGGLVKR